MEEWEGKRWHQMLWLVVKCTWKWPLTEYKTLIRISFDSEMFHVGLETESHVVIFHSCFRQIFSVKIYGLIIYPWCNLGNRICKILTVCSNDLLLVGWQVSLFFPPYFLRCKKISLKNLQKKNKTIHNQTKSNDRNCTKINSRKILIK